MRPTFAELTQALGYPLHYESRSDKELYEQHFIGEWRMVLSSLIRRTDDLVELCPGRSTIVRRGSDFLDAGHYHFAMNADADTRVLTTRCDGLGLDLNPVDPGLSGVGAVVMHHGINDILQHDCSMPGATGDFESEYQAQARRAVRAVQSLASLSPDRLGTVLCDAIAHEVGRLRPGGHLVMNHFQFALDLELGYEEEFYAQMLRHASRWIADYLPLVESTSCGTPGLQCPGIWMIMERV